MIGFKEDFVGVSIFVAYALPSLPEKTRYATLERTQPVKQASP